MLQYNEDKLICQDFTIVSAESVLLLETELDANFFGVFTMNNGNTKTVQFTRVGELHKARVTFYEEDLGSLDKTFFHLEIITLAGMNKTSNKIAVILDPAKLSIGIRKRTTQEITEITKRLAILETTLDKISKGARLQGINIVDYSYARRGMVPTVIDSKGNFMLAFPFADVVKSVNKVPSNESDVTLTVYDIPFNEEKSLGQVVELLTEAIRSLAEQLDRLAIVDQDLNTRLAKVEADLTGHLDNTF